jgi:hypothetical protein
MSTTSSPTGNPVDPFAASKVKDPRIANIKDSADESMDFMLWTSAQATSLAKLKVFHTMAKQINDQQ